MPPSSGGRTRRLLAAGAAGTPAGIALFVYGTLMDAARLRAVAGRSFPRRPARLAGYERIVRAGGPPYVVACPGAHVDGLLVEHIDADSLAALDRYEDEGRLYVRRRVEVLADGESLACETYVGATIARASARERRRRRTSRA